jgi:hypothetical protein
MSDFSPNRIYFKFVRKTLRKITRQLDGVVPGVAHLANCIADVLLNTLPLFIQVCQNRWQEM